MSFMSTHCRQGAYVVLTLGRNGLDELVLVQKVVAGGLVLLGMLQEGCASQLRQLGLVSRPQQHLAYLLADRRHSEQLGAGRDEGVSIGLGSRRRGSLGMGEGKR
jgi:hypothetical protein